MAKRQISYKRTASTRGRKQNSDLKMKKELYIYDNTVRELQIEENPEIERVEKHQSELNRRRRKDREYVNIMNRGYVLFLTGTVIAVFAAAAYYLNLSTSVSENKKQVASLESELIDLKAENDEYEKRLQMSINIDDIRNRAINELGMVYPSKDQIVNYNYEESDYVRQYQKIPQEN